VKRESWDAVIDKPSTIMETGISANTPAENNMSGNATQSKALINLSITINLLVVAVVA
tara:strand:+ start:2043 stop:2216 length:174 start_codon:yes stop_codon:yes gene_type:complete